VIAKRLLLCVWNVK